MKVCSTKVIPDWILKKFFLVNMQEPCQLSPSSLDGYNKSKLLSAKGCDSIVYTEGERETRDLSIDEQLFYKSLPEWNEEHL